MVCDLSNKITLIGDWDPDNLFSPIQPKVPTAVYIDPLIPIAPARAMAVEVPTTSLGQGDYFLDDIIKVFLDCLTINRRNTALVPLAMHVLMTPLSKYEPVSTKETLSLNKLLLEGTSSELMIVFGWLIDTRQLLLRLPQDKFDRWRKELRDLLGEPRIPRIAQESLNWKTSTCSVRHPLVPSFPIAILGSSWFDEGEEYRTPFKIIQGRNRRYHAMGHPAGVSA